MRPSELFRFSAYVLFHMTLCFGLSVLAAFMEIEIRLFKKGPSYANEFAGIPFALALYFIGPINAVLTMPAHVYIFYKKSATLAHWYSVAASITTITATWLFFRL